MLGLQGYDEMLGASLLPLLEEAPDKGSDQVYVESMWSDNYRLAIRTEGFKYIYEAKLPDHPQLYDLHADPQETINLWEQNSEQAQRFEKLRLQHQARVDKSNQEITATEVEGDEEVVARLEALGYIE
jgi:arylsulfatase A-like enzyme